VASKRLTTSSGAELVELAATNHPAFKDVGAELARRAADPRAADALIAAYGTGRMPPWLVAYLLGCVRARQGYDVAREVLLAAPGFLAESYAGSAMARIAGGAAYDDLAKLVMEAPRTRSREGAAYGLQVLKRLDTAALMLRAAQEGRVRRQTAAHIVADLPDVLPTLLDWLTSDDALTEALALEAAFSYIVQTDGEPGAALAWAIRRTLDAGRVKQAPRMREALLKRIAP
jgi:hypothetical protein